MDLRKIAFRIAEVTMRDPALNDLQKRHIAAVVQIQKGIEEYKSVFEEIQKNRRLPGTVTDFAGECIRDAREFGEKVRNWGDDFRSIKRYLGEEEE